VTREKSLVFIVGIEVARVRKPCGSPSPTSIVKTHAFILTFGRLIRVFFQQNNIRQSEKKRERLIISSDSIAPSDKESLDWLEKLCHFPKNLKIILGQFGILFITIMPIFVTNRITLNHSVFITTYFSNFFMLSW